MNQKIILLGTILAIAAISVPMVITYTSDKTPQSESSLPVCTSTRELYNDPPTCVNEYWPDYPNYIDQKDNFYGCPFNRIYQNGECIIIETNDDEESKLIQEMNCDEIIKRSSEGPFHSENRHFAREKIGECSDLEEYFAYYATCDLLYERYHSGQEYWYEEHRKGTENRLEKCSVNPDKQDIKIILEQCDGYFHKYLFPYFASWENSTHYIDNDKCEWRPLHIRGDAVD